MKCDCRSVFNRLSKADRLKLKGAELTKAVTGFIRDDTKAHPGRFPFYATYLFLVATPLPVPGFSTVVLAGTILWARKSRSALALRLKGRLKDAFNDNAALVCRNKDYITANDNDPDIACKIRNGALAWETTRQAYRDTRIAASHACQALKNNFKK